MMTFWIFTVLGSMFALATAQNTCPDSWFTAEFTLVADQVTDAATGAGAINDPDGTYFREVLYRVQ